jgi:DNA-binding transcriptional ArsR family regulator
MARALLVLLLLALVPAASARDLEAASLAPACPVAIEVDAALLRATQCVEGIATALPGVTPELRIALPDPLLPQDGAPASSEGTVRQGGQPHASAEEARLALQAPTARTVAGLSATAALTALGWTFLRLLGVAPLLPSFSRIEDDQLTAHPARRAALEVIQANPGATIQDIQQALGLAWGTTVHHLRRLDRAGLIAVRRDGARRGHWPLGQAPPRDGLSTADRAVAALVKSSPGLTQKDIARLVGVGAPAACKRLGRLEEGGLVTQVREGRSRLYVPTGRLLALDVKAPSIVREVAPALAAEVAAMPPAEHAIVAAAG